MYELIQARQATAQRYCQNAVHVCCLFIIILAIAVLMAWLFQIEPVKSLLPGLPTMKFNTALCFLLTGLAIFTAYFPYHLPPALASIQSALMLWFLVALIAGLSLAEYATGNSFGIDELVVTDPATAPDDWPGRMSPATALSFLLVASSGIVLSLTRGWLVSQGLLLVSLAISGTALLGYTFGVTKFRPVLFSTMALHTALLFVIAAFCLVAGGPDKGLKKGLTSNFSGSRLGRMILPITVGLPIILGKVLLEGLQDNRYGAGFAFALFTLLLIIVFGTVIFIGTRQLDNVEEHLLKSIEFGPTAMLMIDDTGRITMTNALLETMFGHSKEELSGQPIEALIPDRFRGEHVNLRNAFIRNPSPRMMGRGRELYGLRKGGREFPIEVSLAQVGTPSGSYILVAVVDISERVALEEQLRQAQKLEAIGRLAGGIAHDFNNHLTAIMGYTELARELSENETLDATLDDIMQVTGKSSALTSQLLTFSRKQNYKPEVLDLNEHLNESSVFLDRLVKKNIEIQYMQSDDIDLIHADPIQIDQIVMNLVINAEDAMDEGGVLSIETANVDLDAEYARLHTGVHEGKYVQLSFTDNGSGMDEKTKSHIFEPFFTTKAAGKGTGLGLATVHGIVKQCEGHIWVYSEPGKGTIFKIYFPVFEGDHKVAATETVLPSPATTDATILVVEDQGIVRDILVKVLRIKGYEVFEAENGETALALLKRHGYRIDLLLTDIIMPVMGGTELANKAKELYPDMRIIFMSGYSEAILKNRQILDHELAFLQKPITPTALMRKVAEVMSASSRTTGRLQDEQDDDPTERLP